MALSARFALCSKGRRERRAAWDWAEFRRTPAAQQDVIPGKVDTNLLSLAVFYATNAERAKRELPLLKYSKTVEKAAALQSDLMRKRGGIGHENPEAPQWRTLVQRVRWAGLKYRFIAENVATAFDLQYESGRPFYKRRVGRERVLSYAPGGKPIPKQTYASFAEALVASWMRSPGHRANILRKDPEFLGVSCLPGNERKEMTTFYCTQVFFAPREN